MNTAASRGLRKGIRTLIQTIAGGGLTAVVTLIAGGLSPTLQATLMAVFTAAVALAQNYLETAGRIPAFLPSPGLVIAGQADVAAPAPKPPVVGAVDATVAAGTDPGGEVTGVVTDVAGGVVGEVVGQLGEVGDVYDKRESPPPPPPPKKSPPPKKKAV